MRDIQELVDIVEISERANEAFDSLIDRIGDVFRCAALYRTAQFLDPLAFFKLASEIDICITHSGRDPRVIGLCKNALSFAGIAKNECRIGVDGTLSRRQVYFVKNTKGLIKIGSTMTVIERIKQLETGASEELTLLAQIDGSTATEAALHRRFAEYRVHGEWFSPGESLVTYIQIISG